MEEELVRLQTKVEVVNDETSCDDTIIILAEMRKRPSTKPIADTSALNVLLSDETHHLRQVRCLTLRARPHHLIELIVLELNCRLSLLL